MDAFELKTFQSIASEIIINKTKWFLISLYRTPDHANIIIVFEELTSILNNATSRYENIIVMGDINIDFGYQGHIDLIHLLDMQWRSQGGRSPPPFYFSKKRALLKRIFS